MKRIMTARPEESVEEAIRISLPKVAYEDEDSSRPVIYLFGWAGASDEKIAQYSEMYTSQGYLTVTYTGSLLLQYLYLLSSSYVLYYLKIIQFHSSMVVHFHQQ